MHELVEASIQPKIGIPDGKEGHIHNWYEMSGFLLDMGANLDTGEKEGRFLKNYFNAQILMSSVKYPQKVAEGEEQMRKLKKRKGFKDFYKNNSLLLKIIDRAVIGE